MFENCLINFLFMKEEVLSLLKLCTRSKAKAIYNLCQFQHKLQNKKQFLLHTLQMQCMYAWCKFYVRNVTAMTKQLFIQLELQNMFLYEIMIKSVYPVRCCGIANLLCWFVLCYKRHVLKWSIFFCVPLTYTLMEPYPHYFSTNHTLPT